MKTTTFTAAAVALATLIAGCGKSADEAARDATAELEDARRKVEQTLTDGTGDIENAMQEVKNAMNTALGDDVKAADQKELKNLLPEKVGDLERVAVSAEKRGAMGLDVTTANAEYESKDGKGRLSISITDIGRMGSFASLGLNIANAEIDREDRDGFERTLKYKGYRATQKMTRMGEGSLAEMTVFVEDRIVLQIDGENVDFDLVEKTAHAIEGNLLKGLLEGYGITVRLTGESLSGAYSGVPSASEVRVFVPTRSETEALDVIAGYESRRVNAGQWYCGACGEHNDSAFETCWSCGKDAPPEPGPAHNPSI